MSVIQFSKGDLRTLCRLCLKHDDFVVDIYNGVDQNPSKDPLPNRIFSLYNVKVEQNDDLPKKICHRCLYLTESFASFRKNIQKCEAQLQAYVNQIKTNDSKVKEEKLQEETSTNLFEGLNSFHHFENNENENCEITIVNPNQEYESSDDCFSMDESDNEYVNNETINHTIRAEKKPNDTTKSDNRPSVQNLGEAFCEQKNTFLCQYCDMAFTSEIDCDEHESRHDAANPFICNFCPFRTINRQALIQHIKELHANDRPFVCALCNKGFCRRSDLKKHTIVHTGVRPFACSVCSKSFSRNTNLTKHMRIHSGIKPHVCQQCPRSFTTSADLIRHERTHMEVKPHKCTKCPASFSRKDKLHKHHLSHLKKESELISLNAAKPLSNKMLNPNTPFVPFNTEETPKLNFETDGDNNSLLKSTSTNLPQNRPDNFVSKRSNVKVYTCATCSKIFTRKREFLRHQSIHLFGKHRKTKLHRYEDLHQTKQFSCGQCNMSFSKSEALEMHLKIHELHEETQNKEHENVPQTTQMGLGFYSEIRPEE